VATQTVTTFPTDEHIRDQPISNRREQALLKNYLLERELTRTLEMVLGLFERSPCLTPPRWIPSGSKFWYPSGRSSMA
jgi:hypothetical protein